ncbi:MAG TPA: hypothetical protein VEP90_16480 [Methylomirabilota bacterium]|nr:hypothetical protein [Methylomirabilota bacterium]
MVAKKQNLVLQQGSNTHFEFQLFDANGFPLTNSNGYTGVSNFRQSQEANNIYSFAVSFANGILMLDANNVYTNSIIPDNYYYTIEVSIGGTSNRLVEGMIQVSPKM